MKPKVKKEKLLDQNSQKNINVFMECIRPDAADPTFAILKTHLLIEEAMNEYLDKTLVHPEAIDGARFTFFQRLALVKAINTPLSTWVWEAVGALNTLRNQIAHERSAATLQQDFDAFIAVIEAHGPKMPSPTKAAVTAPNASEKRYTKLDLALIGVFVVVVESLKSEVMLHEMKRTITIRASAKPGIPLT